MLGTEENPKVKLEKQGKEIKKIDAILKNLQEKTNELLTSLGITKEEAEANFNDSNKFSDEERQIMKQMRNELMKNIEEELAFERENAPNNEKRKQTFKELGQTGQNWLRL